ncbi:MAG: hypothetical protein Q9N02_04905 [Ghiorsea sp.]|nr:hypothetical protein [Ghiorsea sp.]
MDALLVGIDVGCRKHRVAIGMPDGEQFDLAHQPAGFDDFFKRVEKQASLSKLPVSIGMEAMAAGQDLWMR